VWRSREICKPLGIFDKLKRQNFCDSDCDRSVTINQRTGLVSNRSVTITVRKKNLTAFRSKKISVKSFFEICKNYNSVNIFKSRSKYRSKIVIKLYSITIFSQKTISFLVYKLQIIFNHLFLALIQPSSTPARTWVEN